MILTAESRRRLCSYRMWAEYMFGVFIGVAFASIAFKLTLNWIPPVQVHLLTLVGAFVVRPVIIVVGALMDLFSTADDE